MKIKLKIEHRKLEMLQALYGLAVKYFKPKSDHENLLYQHVIVLNEKLEDMVRRRQDKYTLWMDCKDALAFIQFWQIKPFPLEPYPATIINGLVADIDKKSKEPNDSTTCI